MSSSFSHSICLVLALLAAALLMSLPSTSAQAGCFPCTVSACSTFFNGTAPNVSIGAAAAAIAAAECTTLNTDIGGFIATAQNASCATTVANLACTVIATVNETEVACNTSTIGIGSAFANGSFFQQQCTGAVSCLGYTFQDEVTAAAACGSFQSFLGSIIAQPIPSSVPCTACTITACDGLSTIPNTPSVTFWAGSLPGLAGSACAAQQAVATTLLASGNPGVPNTTIAQTVCNPLAELSLLDTQALCSAGQVDNVFDGIIFASATAMNKTWTADCQQTIPLLFNSTVATALIANNYCLSPSAGLTGYALQYLLNSSSSSPSSSSSSSGGAAVAASSSSSSSGAVAIISSSSSSGSTVSGAVSQAELVVPAIALLVLSSVAMLV